MLHSLPRDQRKRKNRNIPTESVEFLVAMEPNEAKVYAAPAAKHLLGSWVTRCHLLIDLLTFCIRQRAPMVPPAEGFLVPLYGLEIE